jgi:NAD-dependent dihydropyrimidine dehydrogenase PreA subunit
MAYVITEACIGSKDQSCVEVCPVDCIYEAERLMVIHSEECIDCGACLPECPVDAIYPADELPANQMPFARLGHLLLDGVASIDAAVQADLDGRDGLNASAVR